MLKKSAYKNGSYTIELSLLTPVIIAIFLLIYFSDLYMHDRIIIEKTCYISALRSSLCIDDKRREAVATEVFNKELKGRMLAVWDYELSVEVNDEYSKVDFDGNMKMSEGLLNKILSKKPFSYKTTCTANVDNETKYLRNYFRGK